MYCSKCSRVRLPKKVMVKKPLATPPPAAATPPAAASAADAPATVGAGAAQPPPPAGPPPADATRVLLSASGLYVPTAIHAGLPSAPEAAADRASGRRTPSAGSGGHLSNRHQHAHLPSINGADGDLEEDATAAAFHAAVAGARSRSPASTGSGGYARQHQDGSMTCRNARGVVVGTRASRRRTTTTTTTTVTMTAPPRNALRRRRPLRRRPSQPRLLQRSQSSSARLTICCPPRSIAASARRRPTSPPVPRWTLWQRLQRLRASTWMAR